MTLDKWKAQIDILLTKSEKSWRPIMAKRKTNIRQRKDGGRKKNQPNKWPSYPPLWLEFPKVVRDKRGRLFGKCQ